MSSQAAEMANPADDFKQFLLICMWDKRITKHQLILMDLVRNVGILTKAVEQGQVPLKKAIQALTGLQNLYSRLMNYLYDDSQYILNQLDAPVKVKEEGEVHPSTRRARRQNREMTGKNASTLKLDLANSAWWEVGFDHSFLKDHFASVLSSKAHVKDEESTPAMAPALEVRAAEAMIKDETSPMVSELKLLPEQNEPGSSRQSLRDIPLDFNPRDDHEPSGIAMNDMMELGNLELPPEQPKEKLGAERLIEMIQKLENKDLSKIAFGDNQAFDLAFLAEADEQEEDVELQGNEQFVPRDQKKRAQFQKQLLGTDANLKGKVKSRQSDLKKKVQDEVHEQILNMDLLMRQLHLDEPCSDPIDSLLQVEKPKGAPQSFKDVIMRNQELQELIEKSGVKPQLGDDTELFRTPEEMAADEPHQIDLVGEDSANFEFQSMQNDLSEILPPEPKKERTAATLDKVLKAGAGELTMKDLADSKQTAVGTFMDLMFLQKEGKVSLTQTPSSRYGPEFAAIQVNAN